MTHYYEIRIKGHLDPSWSGWFDGLTITHEANGETLLAGMLTDQAALHGALRRVSDLGVQLISVNPVVHAPDDSRKDADKP